MSVRFERETGEDKISVSIKHADCSLDELVETFKSFLLAIGFHPDNVRLVQLTDAPEHDEEE